MAGREVTMGPLVVFAAALLEFHLLITVTVEAVETDIATGDPALRWLGRAGQAGRQGLVPRRFLCSCTALIGFLFANAT